MWRPKCPSTCKVLHHCRTRLLRSLTRLIMALAIRICREAAALIRRIDSPVLLLVASKWLKLRPWGWSNRILRLFSKLHWPMITWKTSPKKTLARESLFRCHWGTRSRSKWKSRHLEGLLTRGILPMGSPMMWYRTFKVSRASKSRSPPRIPTASKRSSSQSLGGAKRAKTRTFLILWTREATHKTHSEASNSPARNSPNNNYKTWGRSPFRWRLVPHKSQNQYSRRECPKNLRPPSSGSSQCPKLLRGGRNQSGMSAMLSRTIWWRSYSIMLRLRRWD